MNTCICFIPMSDKTLKHLYDTSNKDTNDNYNEFNNANISCKDVKAPQDVIVFMNMVLTFCFQVDVIIKENAKIKKLKNTPDPHGV